MPYRCSCCSHPKRDQINRELIKGSDTLATMAKKYGMSTSSLDRHKARHLKLSTSLAQDAANALTVVAMATDLYERATRILDQAEALLAGAEGGARSVQAAAAALREVRGSVDLLARLIVTGPPEQQQSDNAWLDDQITAAVGLLTLPALVSGEDAQVAYILPQPETP